MPHERHSTPVTSRGRCSRASGEDTATGRALNDYLDFVGYRLLDGFDISARYAMEMPDVLLRSIRTAIDTGGRANRTSTAGR